MTAFVTVRLPRAVATPPSCPPDAEPVRSGGVDRERPRVDDNAVVAGRRFHADERWREVLHHELRVAPWVALAATTLGVDQENVAGLNSACRHVWYHIWCELLSSPGAVGGWWGSG
jgi:hypothetical protein